MRSVLKSLHNDVGKFHLLTSDILVLDTIGGEEQSLRLGQIPQWLSAESSVAASEDGHPVWRDGNITLEIRHHSELFQSGAYGGPTFNRCVGYFKQPWLAN